MTIQDFIQARTKHLASLDRDRQTWVSHWMEIRDNISPWHGVGLSGSTMTENNKGYKRGEKIYDDVVHECRRVASAGMQSGMSSPSRPWFQVGISNPGLAEWNPVKTWLESVTGIVSEVFQRSNFYNSLHQIYDELLLFGTGAMAMLPDMNSVLRCRPFSAGEYWMSARWDGRIDQFYRKIPMTVRQIVGQFGIENCSRRVRNMYENGSSETVVVVINCVADLDRDQVPAECRVLPVCSIYWEEGQTDQALDIKGFEEWPLATPRWSVVGQNVWGSGSPGMDYLATAKELHKQRENLLTMSHLLREPPYIVPTSLGSTFSLAPGAMVMHDELAGPGMPQIRPLIEIDPSVIMGIRADIADLQGRMRSGFFNDLFLMIANNPTNDMTAREVAEKHEEKMLMLGPVLERQTAELFTPAIERTFAICLAYGIIPPPPPEIQGQQFRVTYVSIMAQAQKMIGMSGIQSFISFAGSIGQARPEALDTINFDQMIRHAADSTGVPATLLFPEEVVAKIRQGRAQQQAQQQQMQAAMQAPGAIKALSEAKLNQGSALDALAGRAAQ